MKFFLHILIFSLCAFTAPRTIEPKVNIDFSTYYDYEEMGEVLVKLTNAYPDLLTLDVMGKSREGRDIWIITVNNPSTGEHSSKPAMYIDANTHGNEIQGGEVAMFTIYYLVTRFNKDEWVTQLLNDYSFYIAPTVNPDSRHRFFHEPNNPHSPRHNIRPFDNDRDGLLDEDGPEDLNGDGEITQMRRRNVYGNMVSSIDPRAMERKEFNAKGEWEVFWTEGIDNDGDGSINEDGLGGVDLNRQWPWDWEADHRQYGAGPYMLSEPETRATADFIHDHPNIAAVQSYHNAGNMILRPPGTKESSQRGLPSKDKRVMDFMAEKAKNFLPEYEYLEVYSGLYPVSGGFFDWTYGELGIFSFTNELYAFNPDYDGDGNSSQIEQLKWNDDVAHGTCFSDWEPYTHPELGEIEIGGWRSFCTRAPLPDDLFDMAMRNTLFTLMHASFMPKVDFGEVDIIQIDKDFWRVDLEIKNLTAMPTASSQGVRSGYADSDRICFEDVNLLFAGIRESNRRPEEDIHLIQSQLDTRDNCAHIGHVDPYNHKWVTLFVEGKKNKKINVIFSSQKAKSISTEVVLRD